MAIVIMITAFWLGTGTLEPKCIFLSPSIEVVTVTAGVNVPSANRAAPPISAGITSHLARLRTKAYNAKIPPSPRLVALSAIMTYLTVVSSVTVQKMSEIDPKISSRSTLAMPPLPVTIDFIT